MALRAAAGSGWYLTPLAQSAPGMLLTVGLVSFSLFRYIGDPINAVRIFNDKEVDELKRIDEDLNAGGDWDITSNIAISGADQATTILQAAANSAQAMV